MWNSPTLWNTLLEKAPAGSVLMGGAIRDFYWGNEAKDFDIFYSYKPGIPEIDGWKYIPRESPIDGGLDPEYDIQSLDGTNPIGCVYDYEVPIGFSTKVHKVQLIGVHYANPVNHFANFDHSLTLGIWDKQGMFLHKKLVMGFENKTVELLNKTNPEKSMLRAKKVIERISMYELDKWTFLNF